MVDEKIEKNKEFLEALIDDVMHRIMGKALDLTRISEMSDRAQKQFDRTMKDYTNELIIYTTDVLKNKGYIKENK